MVKKYFLGFPLVLMLITSTEVLFAQQLGAPPRKYDINIKLDGYEDKELYLGYYYLDKQYILDTVKVENSRAKFTGTKNFKSGVFFFATDQKQLLFDFINNETEIDLETRINDPIGGMKVNKSSENLLFFNYIKYSGQIYEKQNKLIQALEKAKKDENKTEQEKVEKEIQGLRKEFSDFKKSITVDNSNLFVGKVLKMTDEITLPSPPAYLKDENEIKKWNYYYVREHYFDNFDLGDDRTIRTPIFHKNYKTYWEEWVGKQNFPADTLIKLIDNFAKKCKESEDITRFFLLDKTNEFEKSKIMGMDKVFSHLGTRYFDTKEKAFYVDEGTRLKIYEKAKRMSYSLIGNKALNITLPDSTNVYQSLYNTKAKYTLLLFWDPTCSHCTKEVPHIVEAQKKLQEKDTKVVKYLGVFTVDVHDYSPENRDLQTNNWKKFIKEENFEGIHVRDFNQESPMFRGYYDIQGTPLAYLLDANKTIIAKKFSMQQLLDVLENMDKVYSNR